MSISSENLIKLKAKQTRFIGNIFGNDLTSRNITKSFLVDIRDMDESTGEEGIIIINI